MCWTLWQFFCLWSISCLSIMAASVHCWNKFGSFWPSYRFIIKSCSSCFSRWPIKLHGILFHADTWISHNMYYDPCRQLKLVFHNHNSLVCYWWYLGTSCKFSVVLLSHWLISQLWSQSCRCYLYHTMNSWSCELFFLGIYNHSSLLIVYDHKSRAWSTFTSRFSQVLCCNTTVV